RARLDHQRAGPRRADLPRAERRRAPLRAADRAGRVLRCDRARRPARRRVRPVRPSHDLAGAAMTTTRDSEAMIRLEDLTKVFPGQKQPAVDHLTMEIPEGEIVVLVGPSGCGKTTTMKLINRIIEPTSGRIFIA